MKDFVGQDLNIGDYVVYIPYGRHYPTISRVIDFGKTTVRIFELYYIAYYITNAQYSRYYLHSVGPTKLVKFHNPRAILAELKMTEQQANDALDKLIEEQNKKKHGRKK